MSQGINPNAKPFVPSFLQTPQVVVGRAPSQPQQAPGGATANLAPPPPMQYQQSQPYGGQQYGQPYIPAYYPARPLYPGLASGGSNAGPTPPYQPPVQQARPTYEQLLKSRGTPDSKVLTPNPEGASQTTPPMAPTSAASTAPIALLFLGPRGSGKSTQATKAATALNLLFVSAGELIRERKQPFVELRRLVQEHFGPNAPKAGMYRGLALDRFIVNGETDVYYLQWSLTNLFPVPRVFLLMLDWETALARADARPEESRLKSTQRRMMEYRAHFDACENIYAKIGCLDRVDCEGQDVNAVHALIVSRMQGHIASGKAAVAASTLPPPYIEKDMTTVRMITDVERFTAIKADVHRAIGSINYDIAPVSSMSGVIDGHVLDDPKVRRPLSAYYVTLKADGQRLVVVKHKTGIVGFPQKFTAAYDLSNLFAAVEWPAAPAANPDDRWPTASTTSNVEMVLDCEMLRIPGKPLPVVMVFDFVYFLGTRATSERFALRIKRLREYFTDVKIALHAPKVLALKEYVPAGQLRALLPDLDNAPFAVDGVVFQPDSNYRYGLDKTMYKWKPQSMCTVDFRLYGCTEPETKGADWIFEAKVQETKTEGDKTTTEEVTLPNVHVRIPHAVVIEEQLSDGAIVECVKVPPVVEPSSHSAHHKKPKAQAPAPEVWEYRKNRPDKLVPNRIDIVERVSKMQHISYSQLLSVCDTFK